MSESLLGRPIGPAGRIPGLPEFPPARRSARHWIATALSIAMAAVALLLLAWTIPRVAESNSDLWAAIAFSALATLFVLTAITLLRSSPFSAQNGLVTLPWSVRRRNGVRTRLVRIEEVRSVEQATSPEGYIGIRVTLQDGTAFHLWDPDLPTGAREYLSRLESFLRRSRSENEGERL